VTTRDRQAAIATTGSWQPEEHPMPPMCHEQFWAF